MNKLVDATIVAALLMLNCPIPLPADVPAPPLPQATEVSHGHRPC